MNRFVKKNFALVGILFFALLISLVLLVYALIVNVQRSAFNEETDKLVSQIAGLIKQKPAPVEGNKPLLEQDIKLYTDISRQLRRSFEDPLNDATEVFLRTLKTKPGKDEEGKVIPSKSLSREEFLQLFKTGWDAIPQGNYPQQEYYHRRFRRNFLNWGEAQGAFIAEAQKRTVETVDKTNADALIFDNLGFPRMMRSDPEELKRYMEGMRNKINEMAAEKVTIAFEASEFGFKISEANKYLPADYPLITRHWDIIGDIVKRLLGTGIKVLHGITIRVRPTTAGSLQGSVETAGAYKIYHYTLELSGPMSAIRNVARTLDLAHNDHRFYLVRSVFLFAEENGAQVFFEQAVEEDEEEKKTAQPVAVPRGRGRGRGRAVRIAEVEPQMQDRESEEKRKKKEEERRREQQRKEREMKLPPHERPGYGDVLIGAGQEYRAIMDVDYVVLSNQ